MMPMKTSQDLFPDMDTQPLATSILKQAIKIFLLYSGITLFIFMTLNIYSFRAFDSLNLALTLISSGGFLPTNDLSNILKDNFQIIVLSVLMLFLCFFDVPFLPFPTL